MVFLNRMNFLVFHKIIPIIIKTNWVNKVCIISTKIKLTKVRKFFASKTTFNKMNKLYKKSIPMIVNNIQIVIEINSCFITMLAIYNIESINTSSHSFPVAEMISPKLLSAILFFLFFIINSKT